MKVLMVTDNLYGGGAQLMVRALSSGLARKGHQVSILAEFGGTGIPGVQVFAHPRYVHLAKRVAWRVRPLGRVFSAWCYQTVLSRALKQAQPDLAHVHNVHSHMTLRANPWVYEALGRVVPVVVTLHDMWSFTGRCAHHLGCDQFLTECGPTCPTSSEYPALEPGLIQPAFLKKKNAYSRIRSLAFIAPSKWIQAEAKRGMLGQHRVDHIPNGIDMEVFRPMDKVECRRKLGLPESGVLLMTAALRSASRLKNTELVSQALLSESLRGVKMVVIAQDSTTQAMSEQIIPLGYIADRETMAMAYSAADLYVHPALAESFGLVIAESLACGTPVVAVDRSAMPELVVEGVTGWLSGPEPEEFAAAIRRGLGALESGRRMTDTCREHVARYCDLELVVDKHVELYRELASRSR